MGSVEDACNALTATGTQPDQLLIMTAASCSCSACKSNGVDSITPENIRSLVERVGSGFKDLCLTCVRRDAAECEYCSEDIDDLSVLFGTM